MPFMNATVSQLLGTHYHGQFAFLSYLSFLKVDLHIQLLPTADGIQRTDTSSSFLPQ